MNADQIPLRDYFAARAMQAELMLTGVPGAAAEALSERMGPDDSAAQHIARLAYDMADAMLIERARGK